MGLRDGARPSRDSTSDSLLEYGACFGCRKAGWDDDIRVQHQKLGSYDGEFVELLLLVLAVYQSLEFPLLP